MNPMRTNRVTRTLAAILLLLALLAATALAKAPAAGKDFPPH